MSTETEDQLARLCERQRERIAELEAKIKDGDSAFPCDKLFRDQRGVIVDFIKEGGMSLRDYFAGQALSGMCANPDISKAADAVGLRPIDVRESFADSAYKQADAMLEAREQK